MDQSFGEMRVRKSFNPAEQADVKEAKRLAASIINFCHELQPGVTNTPSLEEEHRLFELAMTSFEEGCMWLVKALTVKQQ